MTTIIGIQGDGFALIAADMQVTAFDGSGFGYQKSVLSSGQPKIATNGKYILGAAGDVRAINILHHAFQPPTPPVGLKGKKLDAFITAKFIPSLRSCFDVHGYSPIESIRDGKDNNSAQQGSAILVVVNGVIYVIDEDYSWASDSSMVYAVGTGAPYALGALLALSNSKSPNQVQARSMALKAMGIASKMDPYSGPPYQTLVQVNKDGTVAVQKKPTPATRKTKK